MAFDETTVWDQESLAETECHLRSMMVRLQELLELPVLTETAFAEIAAIYNNVAYIFLYLESNEAHLRSDHAPRSAFRRRGGSARSLRRRAQRGL